MKYRFLRKLSGGGKFLASLIYFYTFKSFLNWRNPRNINEKINWLKFNSDTTLWSKLSDKFAVRKYVAEMGLAQYLVDFYGSWSDPHKIEWEKLPNAFVLKMNNGSGDVVICKDKKHLQLDDIEAHFAPLFSNDYEMTNAEPHYNRIKPCIVAEELLDVSKQKVSSTSLIDYKIWCFNGHPYSIWACYNRTPEHVLVMDYDTEWNAHPEHCVSTSHYEKSSTLLPRPKKLDVMLEIASKLSKNFPQVRVDLYEVDNKVYFGELTFTSAGGFMTYYTKDYLLELGSQINLR